MAEQLSMEQKKKKQKKEKRKKRKRKQKKQKKKEKQKAAESLFEQKLGVVLKAGAHKQLGERAELQKGSPKQLHSACSSQPAVSSARL